MSDLSEMKFMRKVRVDVSVDVQSYYVWVEPQSNEAATLKLAQDSFQSQEQTILDDATVEVTAHLASEVPDDRMDEQAVTEKEGWVNAYDLKDENGDPVTLTSDERYLDPNYRQSEWYREMLEKAGQQRLPGLEKKDVG